METSRAKKILKDKVTEHPVAGMASRMMTLFSV
jgi:hypothetical protein